MTGVRSVVLICLCLATQRAACFEDAITASQISHCTSLNGSEACTSLQHAGQARPRIDAHSSRNLAQEAQGQPQQPSTQQQHASPHDHKPLFPIGGLEIAVLVIAGVVLFIAAGAGMGGGPVLVPLYLVAGLNTTAAVALSNSTILAGSVGNTLCNVFKKHPYKNKPLIDWDLVLLMEPPTLIGAVAGSYINKLLPAWITSVLLVLLLGLMTVRVTQRAARIYTRESAARREEAAAAAAAAAAANAGGQAHHPDTPILGTARNSTSSSQHIAPAAGQQGVASGVAAAVRGAAGPLHAQGSGASGKGQQDAAGVTQLLASDRAAHVGPSDQHATLPPQPGNTVVVAGWQPITAAEDLSQPRRQAFPFAAAQQEQQQGVQEQRATQLQQQPAAGEAQRAHARRPSSPMGHAHSAPSAAASILGVSGQPGSSTPGHSGYSTPFRGTLSTVPSSVLLNVELEGNISEQALHRLAMIEIEAETHRQSCPDADIDASLASMDGVSLNYTRRRQQQQAAAAAGAGRDGQQQQQHEEPPSEAECRLAYAPPDHTRRDSWELAWGDEELQEIQGAQHTSTAVTRAGTGTQQSAQQAAQQAVAQAVAPSTGLGHSNSPRQQPVSLHVSRSAVQAAQAGGAHGSDSGGRGRLAAAAGAAAPPVASAQGATAAAAASSSRALTRGLQMSVLGLGGTSAAGSSGSRVSTPAEVQVTAAPSQSVNNSNSTGQMPSTQHSSSQQAVPNHSSSRASRKAPEVAAASNAAAIERMLAAEAAQLPVVPVVLLLLMFAAVLLTSLFSKMAPCGSVAYWLVQWSVAPLLLLLWWFSRRRVLRKVALKKQAQLDFHGEVRWTPRKSVVFPCICSIAGVIAGMFGLGGAVVKTPLMLELGVHPLVTAATTQTMLLLTSAASSIVYAELGDTPWDWAAIMLPMAFAATLAGQAAIDWLVKKVGRSSMVVLVLAAFFIVATCLSIYTLSGAARAVAAHPELLGQMGKICK